MSDLIKQIPIEDLEAMIGNVMKQIDIDNPKEAADIINNGKAQITIVRPKWTEKDGVIRFSVTSDGTTGEQWVSRLESNGFRVGDYTKRALRSKSFKPTNGITYEIAVLKGEIFSDNERITKNIRKDAKNRKLTTPNAEVVCLIREKFSDKELEAMGLYWIVVMHEPIKSYDGNHILLNTNRFDGGSWLDMNYCDPGSKWYCGRGFAFVERQVFNS